MDSDKYCKELEVAVKAVHMVCLLCQRVQESLLYKNSDHVQSKDDNSPVTVTAGIHKKPVKLYTAPLPSTQHDGQRDQS